MTETNNAIDIGKLQKDIEYIREALDEIKGLQEANASCLNDVEVEVGKHKTLFKVLGGALVLVYGSLSALAARVLF